MVVCLLGLSTDVNERCDYRDQSSDFRYGRYRFPIHEDYPRRALIMVRDLFNNRFNRERLL